MYHYKHRVGTTAYSVVYIVAAAITLISLSPYALREQAQSQTLEARERELRSLRVRKESPPEPRLDYQQVREDVELLQVLNRHLSEAVGAGPTLDYRQIRKNATEVKKRAARLKTNLLPPEPGKGEKPKKSAEGFTPAGLKSAIDALDALVKSFVGNPISQRPVVLDIEASDGARRDLEGIIRLSEEIRRSAEALGKAAGKNI